MDWTFEHFQIYCCENSQGSMTVAQLCRFTELRTLRLLAEAALDGRFDDDLVNFVEANCPHAFQTAIDRHRDDLMIECLTGLMNAVTELTEILRNPPASIPTPAEPPE